MDTEPFGKLLREYRVASGLSQEALAERAAMSVNGISALERGANQAPQRKTLELLVNALALTAEQARRFERAAMRPSRARVPAANHDATDFPHAVTPFFGRRELIDTIERRMLAVPLVTLVGPGGIGKTRLALESAQILAGHFSAGPHFIDLAPLRDGASVSWTIAAHFGVKSAGGEPAIAAMVKALRTKSALLVIDNCEHVAAGVADVVQAILSGCPAMRVLATSRQPLNVSGEQVLRVPPLEVEASVELFCERAKRAIGEPAFGDADARAIARIVTRLDGIALAIELAAARMNVLTLDDLEQRLSERLHILRGANLTAPRHQAMRATMDWSYDLLDPRERTLFERLWVFPGSFSLDAALAVCAGESSGKWQTFETLAALVDRSLVNSAPEGGSQRYRLLETTRAYAIELAAQTGGSPALRARHAAYYAEIAKRASAGFEAADSTTMWARALEPDLENFRAVLAWALGESGDPQAGVQMLFDLQEFWIVQGLAEEASRRAHAALEAAQPLSDAMSAALWLTIARMRQELFVHPDLTLEAASHAKERYESAGDRRGLALAIRQQAAAHMRLALYPQARAEFERSLQLYKELGDDRMAARGLGYLASLLQVQGDFAQARDLLREVLYAAAAAGDDRMIPTIAMNLAETEFALGDAASAAARARENLLNGVLQKSCDMIATQEANLSVYLLALGRSDEALAMALASIEDASGAFTAVPLQHFAAAIAQGDPDCAAVILGYVDRAFAATAFTREHTERFSRNYIVEALRSLDAGAREEYRRQGEAMNERQILERVRRAARGDRTGIASPSAGEV